MANFNYRINRQGPRGPQGLQGEKGDPGNTFTVSEGVNTPTEYTLIFDGGDGNQFETDNLRNPIVDRGGTYVRYDRDNVTQYIGEPDMAVIDETPGIVNLAGKDTVTPNASDAVAYELLEKTVDELNTALENLDGAIDGLDGRLDTAEGALDQAQGDISQAQLDIVSLDNRVTTNEGNITSLQSGKADKSTTYTKTEVDNALTGKANTVHTHTVSQITNAGALASQNTVDYQTQVTNKPTIPTVGNGTITLIQGGVTKGSFTTNQSGNSTIELDAGGSGGGGGNYTAGNGINITNDVISVKVDNDSIYVNQDGELVANIEDIEDALEAILGGDASIFDDYYTKIQSDSRYVQGSALSQVAISGSYNDLSNKPIIPSAQIQSDWGQTTTSALDYIKNKPTNLVTTDSAQTITGRKTFVGPAAIYFKQSTSTDTLGFTLYDSSNSELAGFQYRPQTINSTTNLLNINTRYANDTLLGFRYWGDPVVNVIAPKPLTSGDYYIPLNITDGTNTVTANSVGTVDISTLLSGGSTPSNMVTTDTQQIITGRKDMAIINIQPSGSTGYLNYITPMSSGSIAISKSTSYDTAGNSSGIILGFNNSAYMTTVAYGGNGNYINMCTQYSTNTAEIRFCNGYKAGQVGSSHAGIGKYGDYTYIRNNNSNDKKVYKITTGGTSSSDFTNFLLESDMLDGTYLKWDSTTGKITVDIQAIKDAINAL